MGWRGERRGKSFGLTIAASGYGLNGLGMGVLFLDNTCCLVLLQTEYDFDPQLAEQKRQP